MEKGKDKSLKNEFEKKFEARKLSDQPLTPPPHTTRSDADYREDVRDAAYREDVRPREESRPREAARPREETRYRDETRAGDETRYKDDAAKTIPVIEEQVRIGKKVVETGKVLISKSLYDEEVTIDLPTVEEEVEVERVQINEYVETMPPPIRYEGDITIIPVLKEVAVVEKRILLVEEIHIRKRQTRTHESQPIRLRKEEIKINRENLDSSKRV